MGSLFDLPASRSSKTTDKNLISKTTSKKTATISVKGGGLMEKISAIKALVEKNLGKYKDRYEVSWKSDNKFEELIDKAIETGIISIDTETTGLDPILDQIVGIGLYTPGRNSLYVPIHHISYITNLEVDGQLEETAIFNGLKRLVDNNIKIVMFNAKFDIRFIKNHIGIELPCYYDAYLAAKCLNENESSSGLKALHAKYVLEGKSDAWNFDSLFHGISFDLIPITTGYIYAARDPEITYELYEWQLPYLTKGSYECESQGLDSVCDVFWNIEMPCIKVLSDMEDVGIAFDLEYSKLLSEKYHKIKDENLNEFYRILDMYKDEIEKYKMTHPNNKLSDPISVSSPTQLAILFYDILGIDPVDDKSPRGTGVEILQKIDNPLCKAILEYRATEKLLSTYIDKLPECVNPKDGRIHCGLNQYGAKTGRMSSDNPNLQNIPSHNKDIRKMFVATEGYVMMSADFSQQEPKVMTAMCKDPGMIQAYKDGKDLYASIASLAFGVPYSDCLEFYTNPDGTWKLDERGERITYKAGKERRTQAKSILLGILYGRGINSVAEQLKTTKQKAQQIQDKIFVGFPAIKQFEEDTIEMAQSVGYVTTFWGRKRRLPEMQLDEFEFSWRPGYGDLDPLSFDSEEILSDVDENTKNKYINKLRKNPYKKRPIIEEAYNEGIIIVDNGGKIADATRQCVNSRIQGSAADMTKIAGAIINSNERLKELGFRLLVPIHDEYLAECPKENAKECAKLFSDCMCQAAESLGLPISCDVEITDRWYGEEVFFD